MEKSKRWWWSLPSCLSSKVLTSSWATRSPRTYPPSSTWKCSSTPTPMFVSPAGCIKTQLTTSATWDGPSTTTSNTSSRATIARSSPPSNHPTLSSLTLVEASTTTRKRVNNPLYRPQWVRFQHQECLPSDPDTPQGRDEEIPWGTKRRMIPCSNIPAWLLSLQSSIILITARIFPSPIWYLLPDSANLWCLPHDDASYLRIRPLKLTGWIS